MKISSRLAVAHVCENFNNRDLYLFPSLAPLDLTSSRPIVPDLPRARRTLELLDELVAGTRNDGGTIAASGDEPDRRSRRKRFIGDARNEDARSASSADEP